MRLEQQVLRGLEYVAYPALAGAAYTLLCLGVVTWLPALAALAHTLHRWRTDGDGRCFTGVFAAFGGYWTALWRHSLASTAVLAVVVANVVFLAGKWPRPVAAALLMVQLGLLAAATVYHLAVAVLAGRDGPARTATAGRDLRRRALVFGFGAWRRGCVLLAVSLLAAPLTLPIVLGPVLYGASLPVLAGLLIADVTSTKSIDQTA
jgi:hypothetical protein